MKKITQHVSLSVFMTLLIISFQSNADPYIGFSLGQATLDDVCDGVPSDVSCDDSDTSFKIFGGSKLNKNVALEAAYVDMGQASLSDGSISATYEATGISFSALGIIPASDTTELFGKVGLMYWDAKADVNGSSPFPEYDKGTDLVFGFGVNIGSSQKFKLRIEFEKLDNIGNESTTGESSVTMLSIGGVIYL